MPGSISSTCNLFADDAKVFRRVNSPQETAVLQADINNLAGWSNDWQRSFNIEKCKRMHIGYGNPCKEYEMQGHILDETSEERDLGVTVDHKLKFHAHCTATAGKAFRTLGLIRKSFQRLDEKTVPILYKTMVRPIIEYGNVIWGPHYKGDQQLLERVQHKATRLVPGFADISYE
ncbi:Hypp4170 [Branchiostoma lanceolatum]|uniref:Hypp4170 protein n=1 Tax=Branchiostoma lanceolatum TaxID=7740 RepID=A0A8K0EX73_BRALA|nr:Hypp4170 [Branchiostoma lanceolatum]